jgi:hypothetical protein
VGAPSSRMNATRTPGDGEFDGIKIGFLSSAESKLSTEDAGDRAGCGQSEVSVPESDTRSRTRPQPLVRRLCAIARKTRCLDR